MITGQAVELTFDADSDRRVIDLWKSVKHGIDLEALGARPHISLAVFRPPVDPGILTKCIEEYAENTTPLELQLSAVGVFPGEEGVVFLSPSSSLQLLDSHRTFHSILEDHGVAPDELYGPGRWVPHCTAAQEVPVDDLAAVVDLARVSNAFGPLSIEQVNLVEFRPVRELRSVAFRQPGR